MLKRHIVIVILVIFGLGGTAAEVCDVEVKTVPEGHLGQSGAFKWLGVLQVHIQDFDKRHVALTGIVLIKPKFALANANDVARIPERVFKEDTVAVFIPAEDTPCALSVISFVVHPEYGDSMVHSLAVIELNITEIKGFSLTPVCLSREHFKKSKTVYLTGFTDEYETLEKVIHKIQTLDNPVCDGFNERRGVIDKSTIPTSYVCGYAPFSAVNCLWDDGMALVSNDTGIITLEGLSIYGPGCTAPARYIEIYPYLSWIELVTSNGGSSELFATPHPQSMDPLDMLTRRRTMFDYVPVHKLFMSDTRRTEESSEELIEILGHSYYHYFLKGKLTHYSITPIERDNHTLAIYRFDEMHEQYENACKDRRVLMYREHFALRMPNEKGEVTYKLSLYDLYNMACICVTLTVNAKQRGKAFLEFREEMDFSGGTEDLMDFDSDMMYKNEPLKTRTDPPPLKKGEKETPKHLRPTWIQMLRPKMVNMRVQKGRVLTNVLYIKFHFDAAATLDFRLFAMPGRPNEPTTLRPEDTEPDTTTEWTTESSTLTGDWSTTTGTPSTTTNISGRRVSEDFWGMHPNRLFKEELAEITADVLDTVAVGSRSSLAKAVLALQCFLSVVFLRADLFIN